MAITPQIAPFHLGRTRTSSLTTTPMTPINPTIGKYHHRSATVMVKGKIFRYSTSPPAIQPRKNIYNSKASVCFLSRYPSHPAAANVTAPPPTDGQNLASPVDLISQCCDIARLIGKKKVFR